VCVDQYQKPFNQKFDSCTCSTNLLDKKPLGRSQLVVRITIFMVALVHRLGRYEYMFLYFPSQTLTCHFRCICFACFSITTISTTRLQLPFNHTKRYGAAGTLTYNSRDGRCRLPNWITKLTFFIQINSTVQVCTQFFFDTIIVDTIQSSSIP
jgi:hypothetical protein